MVLSLSRLMVGAVFIRRSALVWVDAMQHTSFSLFTLPPPRTRIACDRMVLAVCISEGATPSASYTRVPCGKSWVKHLISMVFLFSCANGRHRTDPSVDDGESETGGTLRSHIRPAP